MTEIYSGQSTKASVKLCPKCGSSAITPPGTAFSPASQSTCGGCGWSGRADELVAARFEHELGSDEQVLQTMMTDLRNVLSKDFAKSFGAFLMKWGFISAAVTPKELSQYVVAVAKATMVAMLETRQEIEKERKKL